MRILFASTAFIYLTARTRAACSLSPIQPAEPHACAIERLRRVVLHHKEPVGAACAFVAHELPVGARPPSALIGDRHHRLYVH